MRHFFYGVFATIGVTVLIVWTAIVRGFIPVNADTAPFALERWAARTAVIAGVERRAVHGRNPATGNSALLDGIRVYQQNCEVCHGADGKSSSAVARGLYQRPPQFAQNAIEDIPYSYTSWVIRHGIRLTGMPAFGKSLSVAQINDVALFISRTASLTPEQHFAWSGAAIGRELSAMYAAIGGFRQCVYRPSPKSSPLEYEADASPTRDGRFIVQRIYDLTRHVSELYVIGYDPPRRGYVKIGISLQGAGTVETASGFSKGLLHTTADVGTTAYIKVSQNVAALTNPNNPAFNFQSGSDEGDVIQVGIQATNTSTLRVSNINLAISSANNPSLGAEDAIGQIDNALQRLLNQQAQLGAVVVRLNIDEDSDNVAATNLQAAESNIRDLNVGQATTQFTKLQILVQVGTSVLAQSNANAQSVLTLFR